MSANVLMFDQFADSGRGLLARVVLPNNVVALRENIGDISYTSYLDGEEVESGILDVDVVMMEAAVPWRFDADGYTFFWAAPGELWPESNKPYRVVIDFVVEAPDTQMHGFGFTLVYQANTKNPSTPPS